MLAALCVSWVLCEVPLFPGTDFAIDYGIFGVLLPVLIYLGRSSLKAFGMTALGLIFLSLSRGRYPVVFSACADSSGFLQRHPG